MKCIEVRARGALTVQMNKLMHSEQWTCVEVTSSMLQQVTLLLLIRNRGSARWRAIRLFCIAVYVLFHVTVMVSVKCEVSLELHLMKVDVGCELESTGQRAEYHTNLKSPGMFYSWKGQNWITQVALAALWTDLKGSLVFEVQGINERDKLKGWLG